MEGTSDVVVVMLHPRRAGVNFASNGRKRERRPDTLVLELV